MKKIRIALALASFLTASKLHAATFDDIQFWVGSGANQAALEVDWNDGKSAEALLWGFRWDGAATGLDMFQAVVNADPRLYAHLSFGTAVFGIGYDLNGNGNFGVSSALPFDGGGLAVSSIANDSSVPTDAGDHWREGWSSGYWGYDVKASSADAWGYASTGSADRVLSNGVWDGYSFAPGFVFTDPSEPSMATVPEPATWSLLLSGGLFLVCSRRNRH